MKTSELVRTLKQQGFSVEVSKRTHYKVYSPSGEYVTTMACTPGKGRTLQNTVADLRRKGVNLPRK